MTMTFVGKSIPRKEGRRKVTGQALYVDDLKFEGMLHGVTVRSSVPRGRIKSISFDQPPASTTQAVLTATFPGMNSPSSPPKIFRARTTSL